MQGENTLSYYNDKDTVPRNRSVTITLIADSTSHNVEKKAATLAAIYIQIISHRNPHVKMIHKPKFHLKADNLALPKL